MTNGQENIVDIEKAIYENQNRSLTRALDLIGDQQNIAVAVHPAKLVNDSKVSFREKLSYRLHVIHYLGLWKKKGIPIIHLRDLLNFEGENEELVVSKNREPRLGNYFGVSADYEVTTFPNMGVPLEFFNDYFEQIGIYGIFCPHVSSRGRVLNPFLIGGFTEPSACLIDGLCTIDSVAEENIRIIKGATLSRSSYGLNLDHYVRKRGIDINRVRLD